MTHAQDVVVKLVLTGGIDRCVKSVVPFNERYDPTLSLGRAISNDLRAEGVPMESLWPGVRAWAESFGPDW